MTQLEQLKAKMRHQFRDIRIDDIHECEFHLQQLDTLIETVYQARTEEIMKIAEGCKATIKPTDDAHTFYNKQSWNAALTDFIDTLKNTKISNE